MINISVYGDPKAQPRARAFARNGIVRMYDPSTAEGWKGAIALAAEKYIPNEPLTGPLKVNLTFYFKRPKRLCRKKDLRCRMPHDVKPDRDNCEKAVLDCLTTLGFWKDDCQVCCGEVRKFYCGLDQFKLPGVVIQIELLTERTKP